MPKPTGWMRWAPGLLVLREYQAPWLAHDVVAGLVLATMLAPVGIACRSVGISAAVNAYRDSQGET
jgi:MFS superfamily sulfate permease-like transporter